MNIERGKIFSERAYALGKMLDHSSWQKGAKVLPRNITPSDVDVPNITMFDNRGLIIFCEFSRAFTDWNDIKFGQRLVYEGLIRHSSHCAVVGKHNVDPADERAIDSRLDIVSFQAMVWDFQIIRSKIIAGNQLWQDFIFHWFESSWGARKVRRQIIFKYGCGQ